MTFSEVKSLYTSYRRKERRKIISFLKANGYNVSIAGGCGRSNYTSGGRIAPYNLSNWFFIQAYRLDACYFISLNCFDIDPQSHSRHTLTDRLGICKYKGNYNADYVYTNMLTTDLDLPLSDEDLNRLVDELEEL